MADKNELKTLDIKLPELSNQPIPPENYSIPFHNTKSRLNPDNNVCDFNDYNCYTDVKPSINKKSSKESSSKESGNDVVRSESQPKRLKTEESLKDSDFTCTIRREHTDLADEPYNATEIKKDQTFNIQFKEDQIKLYKNNRNTLSYLCSDSDSSTTFSGSSSASLTENYDNPNSENSNESFGLHSSSSSESSQQDHSSSSTFILPRRDSLDSISVASSLASPELDSSSNSNHTNTNSDITKSNVIEEEDNDVIYSNSNNLDASFSISTTITTTTRTVANTFEERRQSFDSTKEDENDELSIAFD